MGGKRIDTLDDIEAGVRALKRKCPHMKRALALTGLPPLLSLIHI